MKKLLALILLIAFSAALLSGCGNSNTAKKDDLKEEVTLTFYGVFEEKDVKDLKLVQDKINEYIKPKINAKIEIKGIAPANYNDKMTTMLTAGEPVDILFTNFWACEFTRAVSKNLFTPVDSLLNENGADLKKIIDPDLLEGVKVKGALYSIPVNNPYVYQQSFSFNKELAEKFALDPKKIKSFRDLATALESSGIKDSGIAGLALTSNFLPVDKYDFPGGNIPGAVKFEDSNCKVFNQYEDPQFIEILKTYREMNQKGVLQKETSGDAASTKATELLKAGKALCGIFINGPTLDSYLQQLTKRQFVSVPANEYPVKSTRAATSYMLAISATSKHPERAMMFLNLLGTDSYLANLASYGIEGIHYKKTTENRIEWIQPAHDTGYPIYRTVCVDWFSTYLMPGEPDNFWDTCKKENAAGKKSPLFGFTFDTDPIKTEAAALANITREFDYIWRGSADVEPTLKAFNDKLHAAGLDKVMAEMQKQIDEWKKTKK